MISFEDVSKIVGFVTASLAMVGGGWTLADKFGYFHKDILKWSPEHFSISDAPVDGEFKVIVARQKIRDDCDVTSFKLEVRDSDFVVHPAKPSIATFSGPASDTVDKFGYKFKLDTDQKVASGQATLLAHIKYKCPEGEVLVNYPKHQNLNFTIKDKS